MKISPLHIQLITHYPNAISKHGNNVKDFAQNPIAQPTSFSFSECGFYLPNITFKGKEEITPVKDDAFYSDTKGFSKYLHDKITRELKVPSVEDVQIIINGIKDKTGADDSTVRDVIARLAQFSSTRSLDCISKKCKEDDVRKIYDDGQKFSTTSFMNYISHDKEQIQLKGTNKTAVFLDSTFLDLCEIPGSIPDAMLKSDAENVFYIMDGWNGQIDGKKQLYSMFARTGSLKDIAVSVINRMQETGESFDDIFNKPIIDRAKKLIGENAEIKIIQNPKISDTSDEGIRSLLTPPMPSEEEIESYIDIMVDGIKNSNPPEGISFDDVKVRVLISKYLDNMLVCYSPQSLNDELVKKHKEITKLAKQKGYDEDDIVYVIPHNGRNCCSFNLITYQYLLANDISDKRAIKLHMSKKDNEKLIMPGKFYVILDDFSGTGDSLLRARWNIWSTLQNKQNGDIAIAPLIATDSAKDTLQSKERTYLIEPKRISYDDFVKNLLTRFERNTLSYIGGYSGWCGSMTCVAFPFSYPDNNNNLGQLFTALFLNNKNVGNTRSTNRRWCYKMGLEELLDKIIRREHLAGGCLI